MITQLYNSLITNLYISIFLTIVISITLYKKEDRLKLYFFPILFYIYAEISSCIAILYFQIEINYLLLNIYYAILGLLISVEISLVYWEIISNIKIKEIIKKLKDN